MVQYAKQLTAEISTYRTKVEDSEQIVRDLQATGNDSVDNLTSMLKKYHRVKKTTKDEIEKLTHLCTVKDGEIADLSQEIQLLEGIQANAASVFEDKFADARQRLAENRAIIKRQDKLIVDLQQKNELCQIRNSETMDEIQQKKRTQTELELRIKEIEDRRRVIQSGVDKMVTSLECCREYRFEQMRRPQDQRDALFSTLPNVSAKV